MSQDDWVRAPAKVNLGLRVVGRRADGYHLLESLFLPLELADRLRVRVAPAGATAIALRLAGDAACVPADAENLAVRAAARFLAETGCRARVEILLEKHTPAGAGLGGGSSDAAAVLRALGAWCADRGGPVLGAGALAALALELGADVPFFLDPRPAWVTGIGERIEPVRGVPPLALVVVTPTPPLATADVFRAFDAALTPPDPGRRMPAPRDESGRPSIAAMLDELLAGLRELTRELPRERRGDLRTELLENDLEPVAGRLHPAIGRLRTELEGLGAAGVGMSGSGPTMFGLFRDPEQARSAAGRGRWEATDRVLVTRTGGAP
jgi:4-diphosphocytidyl-2-C-methyl-D-erythritol kinase